MMSFRVKSSGQFLSFSFRCKQRYDAHTHKVPNLPSFSFLSKSHPSQLFFVVSHFLSPKPPFSLSHSCPHSHLLWTIPATKTPYIILQPRPRSTPILHIILCSLPFLRLFITSLSRIELAPHYPFLRRNWTCTVEEEFRGPDFDRLVAFVVDVGCAVVITLGPKSQPVADEFGDALELRVGE